MSVDVLVEPFEMKVGFREIDFFNKLNANTQKFMAALNEPDDYLDQTFDTEVDIDKELVKLKAQDLKELTAAIQGVSSEKRAKIKKEEVSKIHLFLNIILANKYYDC